MLQTPLRILTEHSSLADASSIRQDSIRPLDPDQVSQLCCSSQTPALLCQLHHGSNVIIKFVIVTDDDIDIRDCRA